MLHQRSLATFILATKVFHTGAQLLAFRFDPRHALRIAQCRQIALRCLQVVARHSLGGAHEIIKDIRWMGKRRIQFGVFVSHIKPVETILINEVIGTTSEQRLPLHVRRLLTVGFGGFEQYDPGAYALKRKTTQRSRLTTLTVDLEEMDFVS